MHDILLSSILIWPFQEKRKIKINRKGERNGEGPGRKVKICYRKTET